MVDESSAYEIRDSITAYKVSFVVVKLLTYQLLYFIVFYITLNEVNSVYWLHF